MLVLSRRNDESLIIQPDPSHPEDRRITELFAQGPIQITVLASGLSFVRLGIQAPDGFQILRSELIQGQNEPDRESVR